MSENIFAGALVQRASGGPTMLVQAVGEGGLGMGTCARCVWLEGGQFEGIEVPVDELIIAEPLPDILPNHTAGVPEKRKPFSWWRGRPPQGRQTD